MDGSDLQLGFGKGNVDDFAEGNEGVVERLGCDLMIEAADEEGRLLLAGSFGHDWCLVR